MNFSLWKPFSYLGAAGAAGGTGYGVTHSTKTQEKKDEIQVLKLLHEKEVEELKEKHNQQLKTEQSSHNVTKNILKTRLGEGDHILKSIKYYTDNRLTVNACNALSHRRNQGYERKRAFTFNGKTEVLVWDEWGCPVSWLKS